MKKKDRESRLLELWLQRPPEQRRAIDIPGFIHLVQQQNSYLLAGIHGDPHQYLKTVFRFHLLEP